MADHRHVYKWLGISARTVYRYKDLAEPPSRRAYKRKKNALDPFALPLTRINACR